MIIVTYVDDFLITGPDPAAISRFKADLRSQFEIQDLGPAQYYLGVRLIRDNNTITLVQDNYWHKVLEARDLLASRTSKTPLNPGQMVHALPSQEQASKDMLEEYSSSVGSLMYGMVQTRPDLAFALSVTSRYSHNPNSQHMGMVNTILRYISGTRNLGLKLGGTELAQQLMPQWTSPAHKWDTQQGVTITVWTDSDWKGDKATGRSTFGYVVTLGGTAESTAEITNAVIWRARRTDRVMLSTTEAEYHAMCKGTTQGLWLKNLLTELHIPVKEVIINGDNQGAIKLSRNPEFHQRTAHIPLEEHFLRDEIEKQTITTQWVTTDNQLADGLTKSLNGPKHQSFIDRLGLIQAKGVKPGV